ncbi:MAG: bifunctional [glutamine synthetase] adenylyltransferase/[glutamine synthetase]-adenylyl-L-tyrosine phosphorylase, partial [Pseudonocardiaceae bacterium]
MTEGRRTAVSLARLGITDGRAAETLTRLGWWRNGQVRRDAEDTLWALSRAPDPNLALRSLARLGHAVGDGWVELDGLMRRDSGVRGRLLGVLGSSTALGDHLVANPQGWHALASPEAVSPDWAEQAAQRLLVAVGADPKSAANRATLTGVSAQRALRVTYRELITELAAADLAAVVEPDLPV